MDNIVKTNKIKIEIKKKKHYNGHYKVFIFIGDTYYSKFYISEVLEKLNISKEAFEKIINNSDGWFDTLGDLFFSNKWKAKKFIKLLEPYIIMKELE